MENNSVDIVAENMDFKEFLDNIPNTNLPLTIECGFKNILHEKNFNIKYQQFIPKGFEIVGKLNANKDMNLILLAGVGDILYPYLFSFNKNGQKIDSVYLHISTCAEDPNLELSTWSVIDKNISINMTDTAKFFTYLETDNDYIRNLDSTVVNKRTIKMDNAGRFIKTSDESEKE